MITFLTILGIMTVGNCIPLRIPEYKSISHIPDFGDKEWAPIARGQFMRDILFGIHPYSPSNRDAWAKSGYRTLLEKTPSTDWALVMDQNANFPGKLDTLAKPDPKSELAVKTTPQIFRKPTLLGLSLRKRIPKHIISTLSMSIVGNETEMTKGGLGQKSLSNISTIPIIPFTVPIQLPIDRRPHFPTDRVDSARVGRCLIQSVGIPLNTKFYYPTPQPLPMMTPQFGFIVYPPILPRNFNFPPKVIHQQKQQHSPFATRVGYAVQNRLPYPGYLYFYNVPLDLVAMEDKPVGLSSISKKTVPSKEIKIWYHSPDPDPNSASQKLISPKNKKIFAVPSLQAEVVVSSEAKDEKEIKKSDHATAMDKEFRTETLPQPKEVQTVKEDQLVVDVQEPTTQEIPFVTSTQREQPTEDSTLFLE